MKLESFVGGRWISGAGRAGGGEELAGLRGPRRHMQRSAIQGSPAGLERLAADASEANL